MKSWTSLLAVGIAVCIGCGGTDENTVANAGGTQPSNDAGLPDASPDVAGPAADASEAGSSDGAITAPLTLEQLRDPEACKPCHPQAYKEWSGSMHAYASDDPVFRAFNARGQRDVKLGGFCLQCHAVLAYRLGLTTDGSNLDEIPQKYKGIGCYFCHTVDAVTGDNTNPLHLAEDGVMRGQLENPAPTVAHTSMYSTTIDRDQLQSSLMCGACHDIDTGVHGPGDLKTAYLERVYQEWKGSVFSHAPGGASCSQCHMTQSSTDVPGATGVANVPMRRLHSHTFPAVDLALTDQFPEKPEQRREVQQLLDTTLQSALCVKGTGPSAVIQLVLDNVGAGHAWPSGAALVRRGWVELKAFGDDGQIFYQTGVVPDGTPVMSLTGDPDLWLMRDCVFDGNVGQDPLNEVKMPWAPKSMESTVLPAQLTFDRNNPDFYKSHVYRSFPNKTGASLGRMPARVELRIRMEGFGLDIIDDLIRTGDLDQSLRAKMPVFVLGHEPVLAWTASSAKELFLDRDGAPVSCISRTNLLGGANKVPAPRGEHCRPGGGG